MSDEGPQALTYNVHVSAGGEAASTPFVAHNAGDRSATAVK